MWDEVVKMTVKIIISAMWRCVVWYIVIIFLEEHNASIVGVHPTISSFGEAYVETQNDSVSIHTMYLIVLMVFTLQYCQHLNYNAEIMTTNQWFIQKGFGRKHFWLNSKTIHKFGLRDWGNQRKLSSE
jgi:hypothetical protein